MIRNISLEDFKCFHDRITIPLSQITIMYGKNGRGKSTVAQSLLLISQTMLNNNDISNLQLVGKYLELGTFTDVVNCYGSKDHFKIVLDSLNEIVELGYEECPNKPQMAQINQLTVNGISRFDETSETSMATESKDKTVNATSDIQTLQMLKSARYVSAGRLGPVNSIIRKDSLDADDLGVNGENLINVLSRQGIDFIEKVEHALSSILGGATIKLVFKDAERIELYLNSKNESETFRPINVGFGYSYVLPVIVSAFLAKEESLLVIENPEAHLHPGAQSRIMRFLIKIAKEKKLQLIIETHSDHVVNGMRIAMKEQILSEKDAHILYFSNDEEEEQVQMITSDANGTLSDYPDDFLDEWTLQMLKLV